MGPEILMPLSTEDLSSVKRRLLQQRVRGFSEAKRVPGIHPRNPGNPVPLSAEQRRVWLHGSTHPGLPLYNEPFTIHRRGAFDLGVFQRTLNEFVSRHEGWRTSISSEGLVMIHDDVTVPLRYTDLRHLPRAEREAESQRISSLEAQRPIRTDSVPLFHVHVVRMEAHYHRLYFTAHHIIVDGTSIVRILIPELAAIYEALANGNRCPLPRVALQYGDYAVWRAQQVEVAISKHLPYWRETLAGELPILRLPQDRPGTGETVHGGSMECFRIPAELVEKLRRVSRDRDTSLYTILLAAFHVLLFRYSGQNDIIVGSVADGRRRPELENVLGYFLDTFAVRTRPASQLRFSHFLDQARQTVLEALAAADVPFELVVQSINPQRSAGHHPVFQAFFTTRPPVPAFAEGWTLTQMDVTPDASKFLLYLDIFEQAACIEGRFLYCTAVWGAPTIRRMAEHWLVLLDSICQNPESTLGDLPLLTEEEKTSHSNPGGWNDTTRTIPKLTLDELIDNQVRMTPHAVAAVFGDKSWTYADLNLRATTLAKRLQRAGVRRGSIVAILLERSLDLLAGLIAVLKTGGAYVPVDVESPDQLIWNSLADAAPSAILTHGSMVPRIGSITTGLVLVDENPQEQPQSVNSTTKAGDGNRDPEDAAYLIYTSGTTGKPKAVEVSHRSLVNLLISTQVTPGFRQEDIFLALTPISFDIAAMEVFLPLISGGRVVIASREQARDPYLLADIIRRSGCTVVQATPATWRCLLASGWKQGERAADRSRRTLRALCGGEPLTPELAQQLLAADVELWNMYGPTETTIWSLVHRVEQLDKHATAVSIGRPIANTQAYILDDNLQLLPVGVPGELFLGGTGLAKGYRGNAEETNKRFLRVMSVGGRVLYRTGDVAVRRADGTIEVQGRTDNQVKVRGHRIELEAVEAAVLLHPAVASAAARTWPEPNGNCRLSIYIVPRDGFSHQSLTDLREFLSQRLPESMIPSDVIAISALPLTTHGKVDRSQLPRPLKKESLSADTTCSSDEELRIMAIWRDLLSHNNIRVNDNFFDVGGHSLLIAELQQRIEQEFGDRVTFAELYYNPTIRQQAKCLLAKRQSRLPRGVLTLHDRGNGNAIFWVHYLNRELMKAMGHSHPFFVLSLTPEEVASAGKAPSLRDLAASQVNKILATQREDPYIVGGQCVGGALAYEIACQLQRAGKQVSLLVMLDVPNHSTVSSCDTLSKKVNYLRYLARRATESGLRKSWLYCKELATNNLKRIITRRHPSMEMSIAQEIIEAAARSYQPDKYVGAVLLVLALNRPPHRDFLPGWQAVVTEGLHPHFIPSHHRDLLEPCHTRNIADAITQLIAPNDQVPVPDRLEPLLPEKEKV